MQTAEITQEGKHTRIRYKDVEVLTLLSVSDARTFAKSFEDQVDLHGKGGALRRWLGGQGAVLPDSRDALGGHDDAMRPVSDKVKSAIEHTDPAWRHLGVDESAGDPDLRGFTKTDAGFVRHDPNEKAPGVPADPQPVSAQEPPSEEKIEDIMFQRGVPKPGDEKTALDPMPGTPDN